MPLAVSRRAARIRRAVQALFATGLSCLGASRGDAVDPLLLSQYELKVWGAGDGLPQATIQAMAQTASGYLWIGTQEGLARFDGIRFVNFVRENTEVIPHNFVAALAQGAPEEVWIGTTLGLLRLRRGQFELLTTSNGLPHNAVTALVSGGDGELWVGTRRGLARLSGASMLPVESFRRESIRALRRAKDGGLWVGTDAGLARLGTEGVTRFAGGDGLPAGGVLSICEDAQGQVWVGTMDGLYRREGSRYRRSWPIHGRAKPVAALLVDQVGALWIGTLGAGLLRMNADRLEELTPNSGLPDHRVLTLFEGREGELWVGTNRGLARLRRTRFTPLGKREGLSSDAVSSVSGSQKGGVWIATSDRGLDHVKDGGVQHYGTERGLTTDLLTAVLEDSRGALWVGTYGQGLACLEGGRARRLTTRDGLAADTIYALYEDRAGTIWVGTTGGLSRVGNGRIERYTVEQGLSENFVRAIHQDRAGTLWIGTAGGGLNRFEGGKFSHFTTKDGLSSNAVISIHEDDEGDLWLGTYGGGLTLLSGGSFGRVTSREGLHSNVVYQILETADGDFWMSSNRGIFRAREHDLKRAARGQSERVRCLAYGTDDGMRDAECIGGRQPLGWKDRGGRLWLPTAQGVVVVDPGGMASNPVPARAVLEEVLVNGVALDPTLPSSVPPGRGEVRLRHTAPSLLVPRRVDFRYSLDGFDREWVAAGGRREAHYTNLPPGRYRFRVAAANDDGVWGPEVSSAEFQIEPHIYQTAWFRLACAGFLGLALAAGHKLRVRALEARERLLAHRVQEAVSKLKILSGLLPICASCKKIRDDDGYWKQVEAYIGEHSEAVFSHGICPECMKKLYPGVAERVLKRTGQG